MYTSSSGNFVASAAATANSTVTALATTLTIGVVTPDPVYFGEGYSVAYSLSGGDGTYDGAVSMSSDAVAGVCTPDAPGDDAGTCVNGHLV